MSHQSGLAEFKELHPQIPLLPPKARGEQGHQTASALLRVFPTIGFAPSFWGLEALKNEHNSILQSLLETLKCLKKDDESNLVEEKSNMIRKSLEMLELGLSEAQVWPHDMTMNLPVWEDGDFV